MLSGYLGGSGVREGWGVGHPDIWVVGGCSSSRPVLRNGCRGAWGLEGKRGHSSSQGVGMGWWVVAWAVRGDLTVQSPGGVG